MFIFKKYNFLKSILYEAYRINKLICEDIRVNYFGQKFPIKPSTLSLLVNEICNSRCQMCNVWENTQDKEITPDELKDILCDPLFDKLKYVGVSGGEPTLRKDLPDIFRVLTEKSPRILGTGIITNALNKENVIDQISKSAKICKEASIPFNVMISLDGIGDIHDRVRGRFGNFESSLVVIRHFRDNTDIPISIGCTITKDNLWHVDEVLDFCREESVYGRFRIAEFIKRLNNEGNNSCIRNFNKLEAYHLALFFAKLEISYENNPDIRRTYQNIRQMLFENEVRTIGCYWQAMAATLASNGNLLYCAPKSSSLGSTLSRPANKIYSENIQKRKEIFEHHCRSCIHDYLSIETFREWQLAKKTKKWQKRMSLDRALIEAENFKLLHKKNYEKIDSSKFLIIGWYGTETAGDKAILGEIVHKIRKEHPQAEIILASLYFPFISKWTVKELGYPDINIVPAYGEDFLAYSRTADEIVIGGGPLMHLEELGLLLQGFMKAKENGHRTKIAGCGIGPLSRGLKYQRAVAKLLQLADEIELRDSESVSVAKQMTGRADIFNSGDPAVGFVNRWISEHPSLPSRNSPFLNLYLREWTSEYQGDLSDECFKRLKHSFEEQLGNFVRGICSHSNLRPRLLPMHHFCIGNDDRDFNRHFSKTYLAGIDPIIEQKPFSAHEILQSMLEAKLSICMRFHSVVFAKTLDVPFIAIDYTGGGKISAFLSDNKSVENMLSLKDVADGKWHDLLYQINTKPSQV